MHLIWKRYTRSGYAPPWFYAFLGSGFVALAVWALMQRDWLVAGIAAVMVPVTIAGSRLMKQLTAASRTTPQTRDAEEDRNDRPADN